MSRINARSLFEDSLEPSLMLSFDLLNKTREEVAKLAADARGDGRKAEGEG